MDTTEKILKLAYLGWKSGDDITNFLRDNYQVTYRTDKYKDLTLITVRYEDNEGTIHSVKRLIPESWEDEKDPIYHCLRLFRTDNGNLVGPSTEIYDSSEEWT